MAYKQGGNPLSRKSSPLNAKNPFNRVSPINNTISGDKLDLESDNPSIHKPSEHNPKLEGQPMPDKDYEAMSRKSSSPLNAHEEGHPGLGSEPNMDPCSPEFDHEIASDAGYSAADFKQYREANCPEGGEEATTEEVPQ